MKQLKSASKKILGVALILLGFIALLLPFVPFSWIAFFGFELLGIKIMPWRGKKPDNKKEAVGQQPQ